jgi:NAD(P)-dependent dehydrogenase (short-subunit alcohol dehydrogenase family)
MEHGQVSGVMAADLASTLSGRAALVTGGGRGIGREIALELARAGADVAINYYAESERAEATLADISALGVRAAAVAGDVGNPADVERMIDEIVKRFGRLDILVNNAGTQTWTPFLEVTEREWDLVIRTNLKGCFLCTQAAARQMRNAGGGAIVNIGSGCNKVPFPGLVAYTASKGGIEMLTKVAAVELAPYRIRVNCVAPGAIEVERTRLEIDDYAGTWGAVTPLGRVGEPGDVARAVRFLVSDDSAFVTGQTLWVDGGLFTQPPWPKQKT